MITVINVEALFKIMSNDGVKFDTCDVRDDALYWIGEDKKYGIELYNGKLNAVIYTKTECEV